MTRNNESDWIELVLEVSNRKELETFQEDQSFHCCFFKTDIVFVKEKV